MNALLDAHKTYHKRIEGEMVSETIYFHISDGRQQITATIWQGEFNSIGMSIDLKKLAGYWTP